MATSGFGGGGGGSWGGSANQNSNAAWQQKWNEIWNQSYNMGYNQDPGRIQTDPSFQSAVDQGYARGLADWRIAGTGASTSAPINTGTPTPSGPSGQAPSVDPYAQLRSDISGGWDSFINSLGGIQSDLESQRTAQENIANSQYNQALGDLGLQKTQGMQQLGTQRTQTEQNQAKTLRDLAANLRNSFMAGNVYLGALGAGDSSAADQYSYGLTKLGSRQRSDIQQNTANIFNDIAGRETNLTNIYNNAVNNIAAQRDQQINSIAQWFANSQAQIKQMQAQGQLGKSQDLANLSRDILNQAISAINQTRADASNYMTSLNSAIANMQNQVGQIGSQVGNLSGVKYTQPTNQPLVGTPQTTVNGGLFTPAFGYGSSEDKYKNPFSFNA